MCRVSLSIPHRNYVELHNHFFYVSELKQYHKYLSRQEEKVHISELVVFTFLFSLDCFIFVIRNCIYSVQCVLLCFLFIYASGFTDHDVIYPCKAEISFRNCREYSKGVIYSTSLD